MEKLNLNRIRNILTSKKINWEEKRMFGGTCFMIDDKMCFGTSKGKLLVRIDPAEQTDLINKSFAEPMVHGQKEMFGYIYIQQEGYDKDNDLAFWIGKGLEYNPKAKSSKKK